MWYCGWMLLSSVNAHPRAKGLGKTHLHPQVMGNRFKKFLTLKVAFTTQAPPIMLGCFLQLFLLFTKHPKHRNGKWQGNSD